MSRLAQNWVESNYSSVLSPISTLEKSFSNGYNFLKILEARRIVTADDLRDARDENTPNIVLKNMNILTKGLKSINIKLSKQQIADVRLFFLCCIPVLIFLHRLSLNNQAGQLI
jgi:hypothetical protein